MADLPGGHHRAGHRGGALAAAAAVLIGLLACGCATVPSAGPVAAAAVPTPTGGGAAFCCGEIVEGPQPGWNAVQVVNGFLLANVSFAHDHAIARQYLTAAANRTWRPGTAVTILAQSPQVSQEPRLAGPDRRASVVVSLQERAKLNSYGQYTPARSELADQQVFTLEQVNGQWRIDTLPLSYELLLPEDQFRLVYAARDLYFYSQSGPLLVPDPVFVPVESSDLVSTLVTGLLQNPNGWLENAVSTKFPVKTRLTRVQVLSEASGVRTALVDLSVPPGTSRATVQAMAAQLVWTLTGSAYSAAPIQAVQLKINGRLWQPPGGTALGLPWYSRYIPRNRSGTPLYYLSAAGAARTIGHLAHSAPVPGQVGTGRVPLTMIAVSSDGRYLAGVAGGTVYTSDLVAARAHPVHPPGDLRGMLTGISVTSLSWGSGDNLWVAGRSRGSPGVWVIPAGGGGPLSVTLPGGIGAVTGLKVAPDGVRVAMITASGAATRLLLGAVVPAGPAIWITPPVPLALKLTRLSSLTWYDEDHLLAINGSGASSQLWEVPVNGDSPTPENGQPNMLSITAAGPQNPLYLGISGGRMDSAITLGEPWRDVIAGKSAIYPG